MKGKQKYSLWGCWIWTLHWDNKLCPSRGIGVSGTTSKSDRSGCSPKSRPVTGWNNTQEAGQIGPKWLFVFLDLGPGEKRRTEKQAPLSRRKMSLCFSTIMVTRGSSTMMSRSRAWTGNPRTHQSIGNGTPPSTWGQGHLNLQWLPLQRRQGPGGGQGCLLGCPPFGHSLWKCPSCPQWQQTRNLSPHRMGHSLRDVIKSCFFYSFLSF
jgi:hypothetical protein